MLFIVYKTEVDILSLFWGLKLKYFFNTCYTNPMRTVVSCIHQILNSVSTTFVINVENSFEFVEFIRQYYPQITCWLVSLHQHFETTCFKHSQKLGYLHFIKYLFASYFHSSGVLY